MKRHQFRVGNIDCAMCAKKVEDTVAKLPWVTSANLNFSTEKLVVTTDRDDDILPDITRACKQAEADCTVSPYERTNTVSERKKADPLIVLFFIGAVIGIVGICLEKFTQYSLAATVLEWVGIMLALGKTLVRAFTKIFRAHTVDENLLMAISAICAVAIGETLEGFMVVILYQIGKFFEQKAIDKTRNSVKSLMMVKPETVPVFTDGEFADKAVSEVAEGSLILVKAGEIVPLDGIIEEGSCALDLSSLTGESVPANVKEGDSVLSGSVNLNGAIKLRTTGTDENSTITRILQLVETAAERKTKTETVVTRVVKYYVPVVIGCAVLIGLLFGLAGGYGVRESLYKGMIFLAVSCPCAIAISVPMSYFCAIGNASRKGILIKGTNYLDGISAIRTIAVDKTGTLTDGNFTLKKIEVLEGNLTENDVLRYAYYAESNSTHPIARAVVKAAGENADKWAKDTAVSVTDVHETAGVGMRCTVDGHVVEVGRAARGGKDSGTCVDVTVDGKTVATLTLVDAIKNGTKDALDYFRAHSVDTVMFTGDNAETASSVASELGITEYHAQMMPQDKFAAIEKLINAKNKKSDIVAYVGDGINDAPVLSRADLGIAMGLSGSAATVDSADIVLMNDNLAQLTEAHKLSSFTKKVVAENIIATLGVKLLFVSLGLAGITGLAWAVFSDVGLAICTVLNSLRVLRYGGTHRTAGTNGTSERQHRARKHAQTEKHSLSHADGGTNSYAHAHSHEHVHTNTHAQTHAYEHDHEHDHAHSAPNHVEHTNEHADGHLHENGN